jgi:hypothetical protein
MLRTSVTEPAERLGRGSRQGRACQFGGGLDATGVHSARRPKARASTWRAEPPPRTEDAEHAPNVSA